MKTSYDVLVVGAGPAGSTAARRLAEGGLAVGVLEEHEVIGEPVDCTGVLGAEVLSHFDLPPSLVLGSFSAVTINSPGGISASCRKDRPLAYIVDRAELDRCLAARAREAGAVFHLNTRAIDVSRPNGHVEVVCRNGEQHPRTLSARLLILAGGPRFTFHERLGLGTCPLLWRSAHAELAGDGLPNPQVYVGRSVAPGAFAWAVPLKRRGENFVRVGINTHGDAVQYLRQLCATRFPHLVPNGEALGFRSWVIPVVPVARTYADRVLAVGDAAGQVKPTSGGGIYFGMLSAEKAAETALAAFRKGRLDATGLSRYEKLWRAELALDLRIGTLFRRLFARMLDADVDEFFRALSHGHLLAAITERVSFDWHREIITFLLKHPTLARVLLRRCWDKSADPPFAELPAL